MRGRPFIPAGFVDIPVVVHAQDLGTLPEGAEPGGSRPAGDIRVQASRAPKTTSCWHWARAVLHQHRSESRAVITAYLRGCTVKYFSGQLGGRETQLRGGSPHSLCILGVGVDTRRVPAPKSASTATVPLTETMRPKPWRSWHTRSPTQNTSSGGIASRAALKGLAGRRRRCAGGGMYPSSSL